MDELPNTVLDVIFYFCDRGSLAVINCVCKRWKHVFSSSIFPLPALKFSIPQQHLEWVHEHSIRIRCLTLRRADSISWIESCKQLQSLHLEDCRRLDDLTPLSSLAALTSLSVYNCRSATDVSPLMALPQLQRLSLERCFLRDLRPLAGHPSLQELHLAYDCWTVMGLRLPDSLPALLRLRVMSAGIQDLGPLACFTGLQELEVYGVSVYDISPISHLTELQELDLHTLQEDLLNGDMSGLSTLVNLRSLGLQSSDAAVVEATPWTCLTALTRLDLHGSCITDLQPLRCLTGLQALDLTEARVLEDLKPLSELTRLSELLLTGCRQVKDLRPVLHLKAQGVLKVLKKPWCM